jgi:hypothetical protein
MIVLFIAFRRRLFDNMRVNLCKKHGIVKYRDFAFAVAVKQGVIFNLHQKQSRFVTFLARKPRQKTIMLLPP